MASNYSMISGKLAGAYMEGSDCSIILKYFLRHIYQKSLKKATKNLVG
jgi:hypothetical protein